MSRSCEVRFVPIGVEARILRSDGELLYSRIFADGEEAMNFAKEEKNNLLRDEWLEVPLAADRLT